MKKNYLLFLLCFSACILNGYAQSFTSGNLAVLVTAASASNTTGSIVELNTNIANQSTVTTHAISGTGSTGLRFSGSASSTGYLSNTNDRSLLSFTGANSTNTSSNVNTLNPRGVGTFNQIGTFNLPTTYTGSSGDQTRGATSLNNSNWFIADQGGLFTNGATSASPAGNFRSIRSFGGTVYVSSASATSTVIQLNTISAPQSGTLLGLPGLTNNASLQDFYFIQSGSNGINYDVLYIQSATSNTAGSITKYSLVANSWVSNGTYTTAFGGFGLAAQRQGTGAYLYVSTGLGALTNNSVLRLTDINGYNQPISITTASNITLFTATGNSIIKGVAFAPGSFPTDQYRTLTNGTFSSASTFESSTDNFTSVISPATLAPTSSAGVITIRNTVTLNDQRTLDEVVINSGGVLNVAPNTALTLTNGTGDDVTVNQGGSLVIQSTSTGTGSIATLPIGTTITGNVTIERYNNAKQAWRLITSPLKSTGSNVSIFDTWQNGGNNVTGRGTYVTGPGGASATTGLDGTTVRASVQSFNMATNSLEPVTNTKTTPLFTTAATLNTAANQSYFVFIYGDRDPAYAATPSNATARVTTLSATGALQTSDQTFTTNATAPDANTLVGNPYASPVDLKKFRDANLTSNAKTNYYYWDPNLTGMYGVGGYVTVSYDGTGVEIITPSDASHTRFLQSGQAMFLERKADVTSTTASVIFQENQKDATNVTAIFRETSGLEKMDINMKAFSNSVPVTIDGVTAAFKDGYSAGVDDYDASKFFNIGESFALNRNGSNLSIERRPVIVSNDTLFLYMKGMKAGSTYRFQFVPKTSTPLYQHTLKTATCKQVHR